MIVSPYSDGSAYDALIDNALTPTVYDEDEPLADTAAGARRLWFKEVAVPTRQHRPDDPSLSSGRSADARRETGARPNSSREEPT